MSWQSKGRDHFWGFFKPSWVINIAGVVAFQPGQLSGHKKQYNPETSGPPPHEQQLYNISSGTDSEFGTWNSGVRLGALSPNEFFVRTSLRSPPGKWGKNTRETHASIQLG